MLTEEEINFQQDTHWNPYGALIGANLIRQRLELPALEKPVIEEQPKTGGDLSYMCGFFSEYLVPQVNVDMSQIQTESWNDGFIEQYTKTRNETGGRKNKE